MRTYRQRRKRQTAAEPVVKAANRPTKRKNWTEEQMARAIECAQSGTTSYNKAAEVHGVPKSTLKDRLSGRVEAGCLPGPRPYLQPSEEVELTSHLLSASKIGLGKTRYEVMRIAEGVAKHKGVLKGERISHGWWQRFLARNSSLSLRSGEKEKKKQKEQEDKEKRKIERIKKRKECEEEQKRKADERAKKVMEKAKSI